MNRIHTTNIMARHIASVLLSIFLAATWHSVIAATPSTQFTLSGYLNIATYRSFNLSDLKAFAVANPSAQNTVTVPNNSGGSDVYTGIPLYTFLSAFIKTDPAVPKNDILRDYVVATGTDNYKVVFSLGELSPSFGNKNDIIAYQLNGKDLTTDGFARIIAPSDIKAGRWVSNLASLDVGHVPYVLGSGGLSSQFTVIGQVGNPITYNTTSSIGALAISTVTVNTPPLTGTTYTGVSLLGLLNQSSLITDPNIKNDILGKYVIATGSDGYQVVFSLGELSPNFGNQPDLVAYANTPGAPLAADGFAKVVIPGDTAKAGRYVSNLTSLQVVNAPSLTPVECLFNWAEKNYPALFASAGYSTTTSTTYLYRYYPATNNFLGVSVTDFNVYYLGPDRKLQNLNGLAYWLPIAGCQ